VLSAYPKLVSMQPELIIESHVARYPLRGAADGVVGVEVLPREHPMSLDTNPTCSGRVLFIAQ
jgi:hypothetical protein